MNGEQMSSRIRAVLEPLYGRRLKGVVVYGSVARGEAGPDSDIDALVLLDGPIHLWEDLRTAVQATYPLELEYGRMISPKPVDVRQFEEGAFPLYQIAQREGVRA